MRKKWTKIKCFFFANHLTGGQKVLEVINPETGSVRYLSLPEHKLTKHVGKKGKPLWVYFDKKWRIKRICQFKTKPLSPKQIKKVFQEIEDLFKDHE